MFGCTYWLLMGGKTNETYIASSTFFKECVIFSHKCLRKAKGIRDRNCWYEARSCALVFFGFLPWDYLLSKVFMANFRRQSSLSLKNLCVKVFSFWISIATVTIVTLIKRWFLFPCFHCLKLLLSNFYSFLVVFIFFHNVVN